MFVLAVIAQRLAVIPDGYHDRPVQGASPPESDEEPADSYVDVRDLSVVWPS